MFNANVYNMQNLPLLAEEHSFLITRQPRQPTVYSRKQH